MEREREKSEDEIQFEILDLFKVALVEEAIYFHIPNGGYRHISVAKKMSDLGVMAGVPDFALLIPNSPDKIFWLEIKKPKGNLSDAQKEFRDWCGAHGYPWAVARSRDEAESIIKHWGIVRPEYAPLPAG